MPKITKTIWRSTQDGKDLLSLEPGRVTIHAYEVEPRHLRELITAIEEVLERLGDPDFQKPEPPLAQ